MLGEENSAGKPVCSVPIPEYRPLERVRSLRKPDFGAIDVSETPCWARSMSQEHPFGRGRCLRHTLLGAVDVSGTLSFGRWLCL